jgi:hypothetical protein
MTCLVLAFEAVDSGFPVEAHQSEHSITRCMESPAMPENKAPLLLPSFAFLNTSILPRVKRLSLADLHLVHAVTAWHLITTPPLLALPHAGILASSFEVKWYERSPVPMRKLKVPRSCLLYAGWIGDNIYTVDSPADPPPSLLGQVFQPLSPV